jgi:hypothetical protein
MSLTINAAKFVTIPVLGVQLGHPVTGGHKYRDKDEKLTTLLCGEKNIVAKSIETKIEANEEESSREGCV